MNSLPLSWSILNSDADNSKIINQWNIRWLAIQDLPSSKLSFQFQKEFESNSEIIIRGCNAELTEDLKKSGFSSVQIGMEAILNTSQNHFNKKSLKELIRRGKRHGKIVNLSYSIINYTKLKAFRKISTHGNEPQLQNLFQSDFKKNNLLYVFVDDNNKWLGAILLSVNSPIKLHTELILRRSDAPIGIMEALVQHVFIDASKRNFAQLSLGEVPFSSNNLKFDGTKSFFAIKIGRLLNFAYNYKGLYNFKNKFQPNWESLFICTSSKTKIKHLLFIVIYSNFHRLISYNLLYSIKKILFYNILKKPYFFITKQLDFNKT